MGLLAAVVVLVLPLTTRAGTVGGIIDLFSAAIGEGSFFGFILAIINTVVDFVGLALITIAASIVNYTFNFPSFVTAPVVQIGWSVSRDLANMSFILIMLGIAFAYILDLEFYGVKKMIAPLIIMALLLNFSLIIGGVFIDIGNSLGKFFVSGGAGNSTGVGDGIMAAVQAGQLAQIRNNVAANSPIANLIMASVLQLIFYIILAFMLFAMGFVMLYRIVNLWILLILAPLAWVCVAIPKMQSYYGQWWSKFLKWAFYPVGLGFFVYIGTLAGASLFGADIGGSIRDPGGVLGTLLPNTQIATVLQFIVVVMILMMGLAVSESWAGKSGKMVMDLGKSAKDWGLGKMKTTATLAGSKLAQRALYKEGAGGQRTDLRSGIASGLQKIAGAPLIGGLAGRAAGGVLGATSKLADQRKKVVENEEKKLKENSSQTLRLLFDALSKEAQTAAVKILADRGDLEMMSKDDLIAQRLGKNVKTLTDEEKKLELNEAEKELLGDMHPQKNGGITQEKFEASLRYAGTAGLDKEILNAAPQFAEIVGKKIKEVIEKMSPANADKIQRGALQLPTIQEAIKNAVIENHWGSGQLSAIGRKNPKAESDLLEYLRANIQSKELFIAKRLGKTIDELTKKEREGNITPEEKMKVETSKINKKTWGYIIGAPGGATFEEEEEERKETAPAAVTTPTPQPSQGNEELMR